VRLAITAMPDLLVHVRLSLDTLRNADAFTLYKYNVSPETKLVKSSGGIVHVSAMAFAEHSTVARISKKNFFMIHKLD
jgi:hypothetical protein